MKQYSISRDPDTLMIHAGVSDRSTRYVLGHLPFHTATGFDLDASRPGSMDLAIAIAADWLGEHPTDDTVHTQLWVYLAGSGAFYARVRA